MAIEIKVNTTGLCLNSKGIPPLTRKKTVGISQSVKVGRIPVCQCYQCSLGFMDIEMKGVTLNFL